MTIKKAKQKVLWPSEEVNLCSYCYESGVISEMEERVNDWDGYYYCDICKRDDFGGIEGGGTKALRATKTVTDIREIKYKLE